jgi:hypothetical protein
MLQSKQAQRNTHAGLLPIPLADNTRTQHRAENKHNIEKGIDRIFSL